MDERDDGGPMEGVTRQDQVPDPRSDGTAGNHQTKVKDIIKTIRASAKDLEQLLEESNHDEGQKAQQPTADDLSPQDKLESLEEDNRRLKETVKSFQERLQSESRKTQDLHKMMIKAVGHTIAAPNDPQIQAGFEKLKDDIYQLVKRHFPVSCEKFLPTASSDAPELMNRAKIATGLYECFFDNQSYVFGIGPELEEGLAGFEREMLYNGNRAEVELDVVFEWRARTVQMCQKLKIAGKRDCVKQAVDRIWPKVEALCRYQQGEEAPAVKELEALCASALDLAILLRSTKTEFEWEQKQQAFASDYKRKDVDILGSLGPNPDKGEDYTIDRVVFGGLVRGDVKTGRFTDGRVRLIKSGVLIA